VLEGTPLDGGRAYAPGALVGHDTGSTHDYAAAPGRNLVLAVLYHGLAPADLL
jgi:hypothetical protein